MTCVSIVMNSEPKDLSSGAVTPCDISFKILSEKQLEWIQFRAKQKLLEMKEEEEWNKYCQEQNFSNIDLSDNFRGNPINTDDLTNKVVEKTVKSVAAEEAIDHKKTKGTRKLIVMQSNKGKEVQCESTPGLQFSHFKKTLIENPFNPALSRKLNVFKVQKNASAVRANSGSFHDEDEVNAPQSAGPVRERTVNLADLEFDELSRSLSEILLCRKVNRNIGFSLPYSLKQQRYLAWKAYLPSFPKSSIPRKKNPLPSNKSCIEIATSKSNSAGTAASRKVNPKFQNPSTSKATNLKSQEKVNTNPEKENLKGKTKLVPAKEKKLNKQQKGASKKVAENVLNEILDEVVSKVEHEEEERRKRFIFSQLNNILQKLSDIESEESAIHRKWETFIVEKPQANDASVVLSSSTSPIDVSKPSGAVQEKPEQSAVDVVFREALKSFEANMPNVNFETATIPKIPNHLDSSVNEHLTKDANALHQHLTEQNLRLTEADKQTTALTEAVDMLGLKSEREIGITSESLKRIHNYRKYFRQYLRQTSQISREHCEFWKVSTETADQILEECLQEVAEEICEIPSSVIVDLYNQEFEHAYVHS